MTTILPVPQPVTNNDQGILLRGFHTYGNIQLVMDSTFQYRQISLPRVHNTGFTAAVGIGASVTLQAAAVNQRLLFHSILLTVSGAGDYQVQDNAITIYRFRLVANTPFVVPIPPQGDMQLTQNTALTLLNNTGALSDITFTVIGNLVTT